MPRNPLNPRGPYKKRRSVSDRLLSRGVRDNETGCLLWTGATAGQMGYGVIGIDSKNQYAHRVSYELHCGPIPEGHLVLHRCDTPRCFEPTHLFTGTHKQNTADALLKRRIARGACAGAAKLDEVQVSEIKQRLRGGETHAAIACDYPVSRTIITRISLGLLWGHLENEENDVSL